MSAFSVFRMYPHKDQDIFVCDIVTSRRPSWFYGGGHPGPLGSKKMKYREKSIKTGQ